MTYIPGTHISFLEAEQGESKAHQLYIPGTKIIFAKWFPSIEILTIAPAY